MKKVPPAFCTDAQKIMDDEAIRYCRDHYGNAHLGHVNRLVQMAEELRDIKSRMKIGETHVGTDGVVDAEVKREHTELMIKHLMEEVGAVVFDDLGNQDGSTISRARLCYVMPKEI